VDVVSLSNTPQHSSSSLPSLSSPPSIHISEPNDKILPNHRIDLTSRSLSNITSLNNNNNIDQKCDNKNMLNAENDNQLLADSEILYSPADLGSLSSLSSQKQLVHILTFLSNYNMSVF
jgi:hypothetical protein